MAYEYIDQLDQLVSQLPDDKINKLAALRGSYQRDPALDAKIKETEKSFEGLEAPKRDMLSEAIVSFAPAVFGALGGEDAALAAPAAQKQTRDIYEGFKREEKDLFNEKSKSIQDKYKKLLEIDKDAADAFLKRQQYSEGLDLKKQQLQQSAENQQFNRDFRQQVLEDKKLARTNEAARIAREEKNLPQTISQAATYAQRVEDANAQLESILASGYDPTSVKQAVINKISPEFAKSSDQKLLEQAQRNFVNSILRRESGAAISLGEFDSANKQYFPQIGDTKEVLAQKKRNRDVALAGLKTEGAKALERMAPNLPETPKKESFAEKLEKAFQAGLITKEQYEASKGGK